MIRFPVRVSVSCLLLALAGIVAGQDLDARLPTPTSVSVPVDAASALGARGIGSSVLESVVARVTSDRGVVARASPAAHASASSRFSSDSVLAVHERSDRERAGGEPSTRRPRSGWGVAGGPVGRGDWSAWLRADRPEVGGRTDQYSFDGSALVLHLGVERSLKTPGAVDRYSETADRDGEWLAGVGLGSASASVGVTPADASLDHSARLAYSYLGYRDERRLAYALIGGGLGTSELRHPHEADEQDLLLVVAGLGGATVIGGRPDRLEYLMRASALGTFADTDAGSVLDSSTVAAHRLRLGIDARHARSAGRGILSPSAGLGILYDAADDGPGGVAVEADAGVRFDWRRLSFSAHARTLLQSGDELDRTLGVTGAVRFSPDSLGQGFFLALSPTYGAGHGAGPWR